MKKTCPVCGTEFEARRSDMVSCSQKCNLKKWRERNREKMLAALKEYRERNREKERSRLKEYRNRNREKIRQRRKEYRERKREERSKYAKEYHERNREKQLQIFKNSRDKLTCCYIKGLLKKMDLPITSEWIEFYRLKIKTERILRNERKQI